MHTSPLPTRFPTLRHKPTVKDTKSAAELESTAKLVEGSIPNFKTPQERRFYHQVVRSYRAAAREILGKGWSDERGQDIAEYAVMLAVILVIVVGTIRLIGSNANTIFSQTASSIQ